MRVMNAVASTPSSSRSRARAVMSSGVETASVRMASTTAVSTVALPASWKMSGWPAASTAPLPVTMSRHSAERPAGPSTITRPPMERTALTISGTGGKLPQLSQTPPAHEVPATL